MKARFRRKKDSKPAKPKPFDKDDPDTWPMAERHPEEPAHKNEERYKVIAYDYTGRYEFEEKKPEKPWKILLAIILVVISLYLCITNLIPLIITIF